MSFFCYSSMQLGTVSNQVTLGRLNERANWRSQWRLLVGDMSLARSTQLFATGTLLSRIMGLVRDRVVLAIFGASAAHDAYILAFRIPNLLREMLAEGALGNAFTKVFSEVVVADKERAQHLFAQAFYLMGLISTVISLLGVLLAPYLVEFMTILEQGTSYKSTLLLAATSLTRLLFPFLIFMTLGAVCMGVLHQRGQFFITAISPVAFNLGNIIGALWLAEWLSISGPDWVADMFTDKAIAGLALGTLLGGFGQFFWQFWPLRKQVRLSRADLAPSVLFNKDIRKVFTIMIPVVLASSAGQINAVVNTMFASSVGEGALVWLSTAFRLLHLPVGIFGVAIGAAVLPPLTKAIAEAGGLITAKASDQAQNAFEFVLWLMVPCFLVFQWHSFEIIQVLFQSGRFQADDVAQTAEALRVYSYGLLAYGLTKVLTSFYFALERTSYAMKVSMVGVLVNLVANALLVQRFGHVGLAGAYAATIWSNAIWLCVGLMPTGLKLKTSNSLKCITYLCVASLLSWSGYALFYKPLAALTWLDALPIWLGTGLPLLASCIWIACVFILCGLWYLRLPPRRALAQLTSRRQR